MYVTDNIWQLIRSKTRMLVFYTKPFSLLNFCLSKTENWELNKANLIRHPIPSSSFIAKSWKKMKYKSYCWKDCCETKFRNFSVRSTYSKFGARIKLGIL